MSDPGQLWRKMLFWLRRKQLDRDLAEEMRDHLERKTAKNFASGMSAEEARYAAQRQLGNFTRQQEESRQSWGFPLLESLAQDIRYGARGLRKAPGFTTVALLTLALGIGAATAIFSIVNAVLLRPLPYKDSARLVHVWSANPMFPEFRMGQSIPNLNDIKAQAHSFESVAAYEPRKFSLTGSGEPEQISACAITPEFLALFGIHPILGRDFGPEDVQRKTGDVVLLSHGLWQRRFGGDPNIAGKQVRLEEKPYTVAGVLPPGFRYPDKSDVWVPLLVSPAEERQRAHWNYFALAKLRAGVSLESAQTEMNGIAAELGRAYPKDASGLQFPLATIQQGMVGGDKTELLVLLAAVGFLLLIACANVSNLVLSRGLRRQREIAVRAALGASRRRIVRQLLMESLLLAFGGGIGGLMLAVAGVGAFRSLAPAGFPRLEELQAEPAIALFAFVISAVAGVLAGLAPALYTSRSDLDLALKERSAAAASPAKKLSLRGFLVVTEVALALVLLTGSALMVQSMTHMLRVDTGLRTDHLLTAELRLAKAKYGTEDAQRLFLARLLGSLQAQPQITGVAVSNNSLLSHTVALISFDPATLGITDSKATLEARSVSPGFFTTVGVRLLHGRFFTDRDTKGAPEVLIINESLARRLFAGQDPVGRVLKFGSDSKDQFQIAGVVSDTRDIQLNDKPRLQVYFPLFQDPYDAMHVTVRTSLEPAAAVSLLKNSVWAVDKDQPLSHIQTMAQVISQSVAEPRFRTWLLSAFAFTGLALTMIGIYGVISYSVSQRTQEMGIRIALGARPENVLRLVLGQGIRLALLGAAAGLVGSLLLMRLLASQLYEIRPGDPATLAGAALLMLVIALGASYVPARRATRVDPMVALRFE